MRTETAPHLCGTDRVCVQVRPVARPPGRGDGKESAVQQYPVVASGLAPCVRAAPCVMFRQLYVYAVLHGEFDPGSGRTLAACLTHASGATNQGLPWGKAANG